MCGIRQLNTIDKLFLAWEDKYNLDKRRSIYQIMFQPGDIVQITSDATYYTGRQMSPLIKSLSWVVSSVVGDRVVLGKSADGYYDLNAPVADKYLTKVDH